MVLCAWLGSGQRAAAFLRSDEFSADPTAQLGGGGGRYFTGSPADGFDCSVCHTSNPPYSFPIEQKGLPIDGYVPGKPYTQITLSWPQATQKEQEALSTGKKPLIALMAEFVSEDGGNAGKLEFLNQTIRNNRLDEFCAPVVGSTDRRYSATILSVAKNKPVTAITPDVADADAAMGACTAGGDEDQRRCLLWVEPCGAKSITFKWTAPPQLHGPVWFSAGMVATYDATTKPNDADYASVLSVPMNAAPDGKTYESTLESGCSVSGAPRGRGSHALEGWFFMLSAIGIVRRVKRGRRARAAGAALSVCGLALLTQLTAACSDSPVYGTRAEGAVGRFEPALCGDACKMIGPAKCRLGDVDDWKACYLSKDKDKAGSSAPAAGAAGATSIAANALSAMGAGAAPVAPDKINGKLQISFTTTQPPQAISSHIQECIQHEMMDHPGVPPVCTAPNYLAVWIEDAAGKFVKMLEHTAGAYQTSLPLYRVMGEDCVCEMDIVTMPSINVHQTYNLTWDGRDARGEAVPYGKYQVHIEVAIDEKQAWNNPVPFEIAATPAPGMWPLQTPPALPHLGVTLNYLPNQ